MGGLWLVMLIFQVGTIILINLSSQLADHSKYYSIYSVTAPEGINLGERQDAWDPRPSTDSWSPTRGGVTSPTNAQPYRDHSRSPSETLEQPYGVGAAEYREKESAYGYQPNYPRRQESEGMSEAYVTHPDQAYTSQPQPTPMTLVSPEKRYANEADSSMVLPPGAMYPTEGQFGRKTPRDEYNLPYDQAYGGVTYGQSTSAPSYHTQQPHQPYNPQR
ncbi:hypothetical protein FRB99_008407 [Tulasnella sp. 403]|nr:hypothetical protein FRB99_008407 [Tulasnella sp. 403]